MRMKVRRAKIGVKSGLGAFMFIASAIPALYRDFCVLLSWFVVHFVQMRNAGKFVTIANGWGRVELSMSELDFARGLASERTRFREFPCIRSSRQRRAAIELALNTELSPDAARRTLRDLAAATPGAAVVNIVDARKK